MTKKRIALLTGGGDAPGLNSVIESVSLSLLRQNYELVGIVDGFEGVFKEQYINIQEDRIKGIHSEAGTLLGTSNKTGTKGREEEFLSKFKKLNVEGLIAAGGDGTFAGLSAFKKDIPIIGIPKTIDNDLAGTDVTFGFNTAVSVVTEAVDSLRATANAHKRVILIETMGRTAGWIAIGGALASFADAVLIPERPYDPNALLEFLKNKQKTSRGLIVVVAEGAHAQGASPSIAHRVPDSPQAERFGGAAEHLARWIEKNTGWESRHVVLGHLQRAKPPTATDRFLTLGMGLKAAELVAQKKWFQAVVYRNGQVTNAPIEDIMAPARTIDPEHRWIRYAQEIGSFI